MPIRHGVLIALATCALGAGVDAQTARGRVVDADGAAVADAAVYLLPLRSESGVDALVAAARGVLLATPLAEARTAADGAFTAAAPAAGVFDLRVVADGHPELRRAPTRLRVDVDTDLGELRLPPAATVRGRVRAGDTAAPIAGAVVRLLPTSRPWAPGPGRERGIEARTDADGAFELTGAPVGATATLLATAPAHCAVWQPIDIDGAGATCELVLWPGATVTGTVTDRTGVPLAAARVRVAADDDPDRPGAVADTAADGRFALGPLPQRPALRLVATARGHWPQELVVHGTAGGERQFALERAGVRLRVLGVDGAAVDHYRVEIRPDTPIHPPGSVLRDFVAAADQVDGTAWLPQVPAGRFVATVRADGHRAETSAPFAVRRGEPPPLVSLQLHAGVALRGVVAAADGSPLVGAAVRVVEPAPGATGTEHGPLERDAAEQRTDAGGRFAFANLQLQRVLVRIDDRRHCRWTRFVDLEHDGDVVDLGAVALVAGTDVRGRCTAPPGTRRLLVSILGGPVDPTIAGPQLPHRQQVPADASGAFRFAPLPAGDYSLQVTAEGDGADCYGPGRDRLTTTQPVRVAADTAEVVVDVELSVPRGR